MCHHHRAGHQDTDGHHRRHGSESGMIQSHITVTDPFAVHKGFVSLGKFFHLDLFVSKGFDCPYTRQAVLNLGIDICDFFSSQFEGPFHPSI